MADPTETSKQCRRVRASECVSTAFLNARTRGPPPPPPFPPNDNGTEPKNRPAEDTPLVGFHRLQGPAAAGAGYSS